jgi:hypothetical protein
MSSLVDLLLLLPFLSERQSFWLIAKVRLSPSKQDQGVGSEWHSKRIFCRVSGTALAAGLCGKYLPFRAGG